MTELVTKHDAPTTLLIRIATASGPRTIIASDIPLQDAGLIAAAMHQAGHYAEAREPGSVLSLAAHMKRHKQAQAKRSGGSNLLKFGKRAGCPSWIT